MREAYPSDVSREQFAKIEPSLEGVRKTTRPRKVDLYEVFCALLYLLKNACTWRAIPHDFPDWRLVYYYNSIWSKKDENNRSTLDYILADLEDAERVNRERNSTPSMIIVDSKTIQNADTAGEKGYDGGKKKQE